MPLHKVNSKLLIVNGNKSIHHLPFSIHSKVKQGFTLIELLIVITIIGILASLTLASYGNAQAKARDGVRKSDLAQVKRALELAKADCQGAAYYPYWSTNASLTTAYTDYDNAAPIGLAQHLSNTTLNYISSVIQDPKNDATLGQKYAYFTGAGTVSVCPDTSGTFTKSGASNYALSVKLERTSDIDAVNSRTRCAGKPGDSATQWNQAGYYVICNN